MSRRYPDGNASAGEMEELLVFAMEARRRVREHILRIDDTFKRHDFVYRPLNGGSPVTVQTPEEIQYPAFAEPKAEPPGQVAAESREISIEEAKAAPPLVAEHIPVDSAQPGHLVMPENTKGWSYRRLFALHLKGASKIRISDPYVRQFFQVRNLMEFLRMVHDLTPEGDEVAIHLVTQSEPESCVRQAENLDQMVSTFGASRIAFSWELDHSPNFHARSISTDTGWKITIDRGLDLFQKFEGGPFSAEQAIQECRLTRGAEITYLRSDQAVATMSEIRKVEGRA